ncbi:DUF1995 family protein [Phormidium yuhuli AB48]|uniref:DUF1995 family protein n=1 Tax=Phormidium yuhuli AB48 TaxID=2940671 RepID=A0ABY5AUV8_9CYAN|nr:DUF1995 family protein [Phormidium yuhuli]USR92825.1 DUF1995 family protein [Phormidium yuhuli AB48]
MDTTDKRIELPDDLEDAIAQAKAATKAALEDGYRLIQVEIVYPELKAQPIAETFIPVLTEMGYTLKVMFPDTGAAALARRDWGDTPFKITDVGSRRLPVTSQMEETDECYLLVEPSDVEIEQVEKLANEAGDRPVILLLPRLESVATVGIGYAARQLRERFLSKITSCYYVRPLPGGALLRIYPSPWIVWSLNEDNQYEVLTEMSYKPVGEELERLLMGEELEPESSEAAEADPGASPNPSKPKSRGLFAEVQRFIRALTQ